MPAISELPEVFRQQLVLAVGMVLVETPFEFGSEIPPDLRTSIMSAAKLGEKKNDGDDDEPEIDYLGICEAMKSFFFGPAFNGANDLSKDWLELADCEIVDIEDAAIWTTQLLLVWLMRRSKHAGRIAFVEARTRMLIDCNPIVLKKGGYLLNLFCVFPDVKKWNYVHTNKSFDIKLFELIFERGMVHYPTDMGFLFHKNTFQNACEMFGTKTVAKIVNDKILATRGKNSISELQNWLSTSATNNDVSLDGVYTLLRNDPSTVS